MAMCAGGETGGREEAARLGEVHAEMRQHGTQSRAGLSRKTKVINTIKKEHSLQFL
jgi:hypothetical protein